MGNVFGQQTAKRAQKKQSMLIKRQRQADELELAEEEDVVARKRALAKSGMAGRSSLIKTSQSGVKSNNLGGVTS